MEAKVDTLCLLAQPKEGQQQIKKTKNNQNCQKIKVYGSPTNKELKKKHSSSLVGGAEMGSWGGENLWQDGSWWNGQSHIWVWTNQEEQLERDRPHNPGFQHGK